MKYSAPAALALATAAALAVTQVATVASAAPPPREKRACFRTSDIAGWREGERGTFNLRTLRGDVFTSRLMGVCPDIDWSNSLAIKTRSSSFVCEGDDATLIVPRSASTANFPQRCDIDKLRKLSTEEAAGLEKKYRP